jgi:hypothetical protein
MLWWNLLASRRLARTLAMVAYWIALAAAYRIALAAAYRNDLEFTVYKSIRNQRLEVEVARYYPEGRRAV